MQDTEYLYTSKLEKYTVKSLWNTLIPGTTSVQSVYTLGTN